MNVTAPPRPIQMVDLQGQYAKLQNKMDQAIADVIHSTQFINGPVVRQFSQKLADYLQVKHVIPCANGTDALQIALMALDLKPGDEVITCPFTFVATAEVIALLQLKPVFVDVHPDTFLIDASKIEAAITDRTKAIIPVHLFGQGADMQEIMRIAEQYNIAVIEDNAQAIGADFYFENKSSQKFGTIGHIGCTSFFPSKNLGCYGDGGAIFTNNDDLAKKLEVIVNHGMKVRYYHDEIGVNSRLDSIQAAVLNVKLPHLDTYNEERRRAADFYDSLLRGIEGIYIPVRSNQSSHVFHQYTLQLDHNRDQVAQHLQSKQVPFGIYYPVPLHLQRAYRSYGYKEGDFVVSESLASRVISLPMHTELDEETQVYIVESLLEGFHRS